MSTALAVCEAAWAIAGPAILHVGDFSASGARVLFVSPALVSGLSDAVVPLVGAELRLFGQNMDDTSHCGIGSVFPVRARPLDSNTLECVAVSRCEGIAPVTVGLNSQCSSSGWIPLRYARVAQVEYVSPPSGPASGGTLLELLGRSISSSYHLSSCHVGGSRSKVVTLPEGVGCMTPAGPPGFVSVGLGGPGSSDAIFHYREVAVVHSVSRQTAWVDDGALFYLSGTNVVEECYVGSESDRKLVPSQLVSTGLVICEVIWPEQGTASIRIGEVSDAGVGINFEEKTFATETSPSGIPESGGAAFEISGRGFAPSSGTHCSFGSVSPVRGRHLHNAVECMSPSLAPVL